MAPYVCNKHVKPTVITFHDISCGYYKRKDVDSENRVTPSIEKERTETNQILDDFTDKNDTKEELYKDKTDCDAAKKARGVKVEEENQNAVG